MPHPAGFSLRQGARHRFDYACAPFDRENPAGYDLSAPRNFKPLELSLSVMSYCGTAMPHAAGFSLRQGARHRFDYACAPFGCGNRWIPRVASPGLPGRSLVGICHITPLFDKRVVCKSRCSRFAIERQESARKTVIRSWSDSNFH